MPGRRPAVALAAAAALLLVGCAGKRLVGGVYHAPEGYRVTVPGPAWTVAGESRAGLELRHRSRPAGMLVNAVCDPRVAGRRPAVLERHLFLGVRDRTVLEHGEVALNGSPAAHTVMEGRMRGREDRVRVETYTLAR
ncbi:MAG TPA: hypothetical protein VFX28_07070, partial [Methylomirabilota bacterium]|nr:hypothetical protein [Methylomirabilota bacterium]